MSTRLELISQLIQDCENRESRLSDWETNFIDSISKQLEKKGDLSDKQMETLSKIWDKATDRG